MTKQAIIERTIKIIKQLPDDKVEQISDFADFVIKKFEETLLTKNIQKMTSDSQTLNFLKSEEDLYSLEDLKTQYV